MPKNSPLSQGLQIIRTKFNSWFFLGMLTFTSAVLFEMYMLIGPPMSLSEKAALGDTINGLTAPLIGIIGAVLIYVSLREQVKSNKFHFQILYEQREWDLLYRLLEDLKEDLKNLQASYGPRYNSNDILETFMSNVIADNQTNSPFPDVGKYLDYIFKQFAFLSARINQTENLGTAEKLHLIERCRQIFNLYFESYYSRVVNHEFTSRFSVAFSTNFEQGGKAVINLNALSIAILKEKFQNAKQA
jgi:hypothetical protein